jgi:Bax protein|tara:strand:+ start:3019 stop:3717 length:699 start_codon:yes stop_codon:yes gene_type:complete
MKKLIVLCTILFSPVVFSAIPDFASYTDVKQKKTAFFDYMYLLVLAENKKVMRDRRIVKAGEPSDKLRNICEKYSNNCEQIDQVKRNELLVRVDVIPPSLVLAQSANESAWGTSRFAKQGNNFFGQWCYSKGCGLVPLQRNAGTKHEVRKFDSPQQSVGGYIFNLNTGRAYSSLRKKRAIARANDDLPSGHDLASGLTKYSERGDEYVKEIRSMISYNKLVKKYGNKFWQEL